MATEENIIGEVWKTIEKYPDYEVSSLGEVRSKSHFEIYIVYGTKAVRWRIGRILAASPDNKGYPVVLLQGKKWKVHVLVCEAFHGPRPSKRHQVAHWDGSTDNNRAKNLRWATPKENYSDSVRHKTARLGPYRLSLEGPLENPDQNFVRGEDHFCAKLNEQNVLEIRRMKREGIHPKEIAENFSINESTVYNIVSRHTWKHI